MSLKDIREYIHLAMEGDSTIEERLQLFYRQRKILQAQMEELQHTMDVLDFKCWYYETARDAGTVQVPQSMSVEELPPQFRNLQRCRLLIEIGSFPVTPANFLFCNLFSNSCNLPLTSFVL